MAEQEISEVSHPEARVAFMYAALQLASDAIFAAEQDALESNDLASGVDRRSSLSHTGSGADYSPLSENTSGGTPAVHQPDELAGSAVSPPLTAVNSKRRKVNSTVSFHSAPASSARRYTALGLVEEAIELGVPVPMMQFLVDPESFTRTIENLFDFSFLLVRPIR
mgnify:CR=1 FL=1